MRTRARHSLEAVLTEAVAILDESGEKALTFRALAGRLGGGVASIYWYVSDRDDLLARAADHVVGGLLEATGEQGDEAGADPVAEIRALAVALFDVVEQRPWLAGYFMANTGVQPNSMRLYERLGQPLLRLDLTARQRFHAASAVIGFVIGTAADLGQEPPQELLDGVVGRDEFLGRYAEQWRALDAAEFPFVHEIADEFAHHDDAEQFRAGLDLLLAGLRLQAGAGRP